MSSRYANEARAALLSVRVQRTEQLGDTDTVMKTSTDADMRTGENTSDSRFEFINRFLFVLLKPLSFLIFIADSKRGGGVNV